MNINSRNFKKYESRPEHDCDFCVQIIDDSLSPWYPEGSILGFNRRCSVNHDALVVVEAPDGNQFVVAYDDTGFDFYNNRYALRYPNDDLVIIGVMECEPLYVPKVFFDILTKEVVDVDEVSRISDFDLQTFASERCAKCDNFEESFNDFLLDYAWILASRIPNIRKMGHDYFISFLRDDIDYSESPNGTYLKIVHNTIERIVSYFARNAMGEIDALDLVAELVDSNY